MNALGVRLVVSSGGKGFYEGETAEAKGRPDAAIADKVSGPPLEGFGGAFNEKGWEALGILSAAERQRVLSDLFAPQGGLCLNFCRVPIGSSDYALSRYCLAPQENDYGMKGFSIDRDRQALIPFIKAALALKPDMRFWASAWSPPPWLKDNNDYDSGAMRDDPEAYAALALYLCTFAEAYRAEGIAIEAVAVQNEPIVLTHYPSCEWKPFQYLCFVRDYFGPLLAERKSGAGILLGTFPRPVCASHALAVLTDAKARGYVTALGLQWFGLPIAEGARKIAPELPIWNSETDCGNYHWEPGFDPDKPEADFGYANKTWGYMREYLAAGTSLYTLWNMVLDDEGKNLDSKRPWPQNAPIMVDRKSARAVYTPMYYAAGHFSRFLPPGSRLLECSDAPDAIGFRLPDGSAAVVLRNPGRFGRRMRIAIGKRTVLAKLPGRCFATLLVDSGSY
jgi:glucosylceramidase